MDQLINLFDQPKLNQEDTKQLKQIYNKQRN
jgi:hypothetical protein